MLINLRGANAPIKKSSQNQGGLTGVQPPLPKFRDPPPLFGAPDQCTCTCSCIVPSNTLFLVRLKKATPFLFGSPAESDSFSRVRYM